ncbi:MAG: Vitamin epoxide reductase [Acidimicrobiaceae bacterium]|nr:Vitamin epoxide reductase [Acidimicrobiaceae bacterium]
MVVTPLLCVLGLGVSIYLTVAHYTQAVLAFCAENSTINCEKVTTSPQSEVFGIPVAVLGLAFFVPMLVLCLPVAWRSANRFVAPLRMASAVVGIGFVCYLLYAELFEIKAICLYCTSVHVLTFLVFVCVVTGWDQARAPYWDQQPDPPAG